MEGLDAMWHDTQCVACNGVLDYLHPMRNEMPVVSRGANCERFALPNMLGLEDEKDLAIASGRQVKEVHGLVSYGDLCTGHVAADGEVVRLALDERGWVFATKIEPMSLLGRADS